jgi:hypothetical protein
MFLHGIIEKYDFVVVRLSPMHACAGNGQVYLHGVRGAPLQKYAFTGERLALAASSAVVGNFSNRASVPIVSAVSAQATEAIVWEVDASDVLFAWDASRCKSYVS